MTSYVPMHGSAPLALRAASCLGERGRAATCRACVEACPARVLTRHDAAPVLSDGCLGCGRCAAVCPTEALRVHGFAVTPPAGDTAVTLECWRVDPADGRADALRVPCLNGLTLGRLLAITAGAGGRPLSLIDRGFCTACPAAGGDMRPARGVLAAAGDLLGALGVPASLHPRLIERPLPSGRMQADPAGFVLEERVSRRGFLTGLTARAAAAAPLAEVLPAPGPTPSPAGSTWRRPAPPEDRARLLEALGRLAPGVPLPTRLFPSLKAAATCAGHGVCAAACPTGALSGYTRTGEQGAERGIDFDPRACVACGLCVTLCPTRSLALAEDGEAGADGGPQAPRTLTRHRQQTCVRCGAGFAGEPGACPACRRDQAFAASAFGTLFGGAGRV